MLPPLPNRWVYGEKVPFQESDVVEFKEVSVFSGLFRHKSVGNSGLPKYRETIIGFLNGGEGYLIMGIKNDGTILGVVNTTDETMDMFRLWIDSHFNSLVYKNGKPIDPAKVSIKYSAYPVVSAEADTRNCGAASVIVVEALNRGKPVDIMTRSGTIVRRLNASNFKVTSEPVYRHRDVKGLIYAVQSQMQRLLADKKKVIENLEEKHKEEVYKARLEERASIRDYIELISTSLYQKYKMDMMEDSICVRIMKYVLCMKPVAWE